MGILKDLRKHQWEQLCRRCGLCCHEKLVSANEVKYLLHVPCRYLDQETNLCRSYSTRFRKHQRCRKVNIWRAMFAAYLPEDCGYVHWAERRHIRFARRRKITYLSGENSRQ